MSRRIGRLVTAAVLSGSLAIGFAGFSAPAVANPNNSQRAEVVASVHASGSYFFEAVSELQPYVRRAPVDGTLSLTAPAAVLQDIRKDVLDNIRGGMEIVNQQVRAGNLKTTDALDVYDANAATSL